MNSWPLFDFVNQPYNEQWHLAMLVLLYTHKAKRVCEILCRICIHLSSCCHCCCLSVHHPHPNPTSHTLYPWHFQHVYTTA